MIFGEEPSHFLNMMGGDFITLQVSNDIVVTIIITVITIVEELLSNIWVVWVSVQMQ